MARGSSQNSTRGNRRRLISSVIAIRWPSGPRSETRVRPTCVQQARFFFERKARRAMHSRPGLIGERTLRIIAQPPHGGNHPGEIPAPQITVARTRRLACEGCGKSIEHRTGRRPRFCSSRCRMRAFRNENPIKNGTRYPTSGAATKRPKIDSENKALQEAKSRSSPRIIGPAHVLAVEVFDRPWRSIISTGGVAVEVSQLRPRALVSL